MPHICRKKRLNHGSSRGDIETLTQSEEQKAANLSARLEDAREGEIRLEVVRLREARQLERFFGHIRSMYSRYYKFRAFSTRN